MHRIRRLYSRKTIEIYKNTFVFYTGYYCYNLCGQDSFVKYWRCMIVRLPHTFFLNLINLHVCTSRVDSYKQ